MRAFREDQPRSPARGRTPSVPDPHALLRLQRQAGNAAVVQRYGRGRAGVLDNGRLVADTDARPVTGRGRVRLAAGTYVEVVAGPVGGSAEYRVRVWTPNRRGTEYLVPAASFAQEPQLAERRGVPDGAVAGYRAAAGPLYGPGGHPEPSDVHQGTLGDCYLLAAVIAVLQTNPAYVESLIDPHPVVGPGGALAYRVGLRTARHVPGGGLSYTRVDRVVDAHFPHLALGTPAYSGMGAGPAAPIWPMLLEKRYAQREGGYDDIESGQVTVALEALTGRPARHNDDPDLRADATSLAHGLGQEVRPQDVDPLRADDGPALVARIGRYLAQGRPVVLGTPDAYGSAALRAEARRLRVHTDHGYPVVAVTADGVRLRNPWGTDHPSRALTGDEVKRLCVDLHSGESLTGPNATPPTLPAGGPDHR